MAPREVPAADPTAAHPELDRFVAVMEILRTECPWDAEQTHMSLVQYLVEETMETVEAIETADTGAPAQGTGAVDPAVARADLREELGDLLLQVIFHATIAAEDRAFDIDDVARSVADKLIARHPYVFATEELPDNLEDTWEQRKRRLKGRTSALDGIPHRLSAMHRAAKVVKRVRSHDVDLAGQGIELSTEPITEQELGEAVLELVARAQASGVDPEQATRTALRGLEDAVRAVEPQQRQGA